jgi:transaldolase
LITQGLRGQTSNPTIFKQSITGSSDYDLTITQLASKGKSVFEIYDALTIQDVADASDLFKGVYQSTHGVDGYVSLEINPQLANTHQEQLEEGMRLWKALNRPNVMIKVPATKNGIKVFEDLIAQGVNVNVTLIFSAEQYQQVAWSYIKGLEKLCFNGGDVTKVFSVASVFVSRIDTAVDKWIDANNKDKGLRGKAAVANSEVIYHKFNKTFESEEFKRLRSRGANIQRVLWASTATKDPQYSDVKYIQELMASSTVNTVPDKTLNAFLDHGKVEMVLPKDVARAQHVIEQLRLAGIDVGVLCNQLLSDGLDAFVTSFDELLASIEQKSKSLVSR